MSSKSSFSSLAQSLLIPIINLAEYLIRAAGRIIVIQGNPAPFTTLISFATSSCARFSSPNAPESFLLKWHIFLLLTNIAGTKSISLLRDSVKNTVKGSEGNSRGGLSGNFRNALISFAAAVKRLQQEQRTPVFPSHQSYAVLSTITEVFPERGLPEPS